jgi:Flp pilus assembly protein TadD
LAEAHDGLGELLASSGDLVRAENEFREALRIEPDMPSAQSNLGHALAARGALPEAAGISKELWVAAPTMPTCASIIPRR